MIVNCLEISRRTSLLRTKVFSCLFILCLGAFSLVAESPPTSQDNQKSPTADVNGMCLAFSTQNPPKLNWTAFKFTDKTAVQVRLSKLNIQHQRAAGHLKN